MTLHIDCNVASVTDLARAFWELDSLEQAEFFERVVDISEADWDDHHRRGESYLRFPPDFQWMYLAEHATERQRNAIRTVTANVWLKLSGWLERATVYP